MYPFQSLSQIDAHIPSSASHIVVGNFNEDLYCNSTPIKEPMTALEFTQIVNDLTTNYGSLLDHIYIKNLPYQLSTSIADIHFTDHDLTLLNISFN